MQLAAHAASAAGLERVLLISRHGERERLVKHSTTLHEHSTGEGGPALTLDGLDRVHHTGAMLRARYLEPATCGDRCLLNFDAQQPDHTYAESSGLARTLGTATVLLQGLVPDFARAASPSGVPQPLPVYSRHDADDYLLRGYANGKCPALAVGLDAQQQEFADKEAATASLRADLGGALSESADALGVPLDSSGAVPLRDAFNAYDALATSTPSLVSASRLAEAEALAAWTESRRFGVRGGGVLCGGAMLAEAVSRLTAGLGAPSAVPSTEVPGANASSVPRLSFFSAHYPLMLCTLAALGLGADSGHAEDAWLGERLLGLGSVLAFELHGGDHRYSGDSGDHRVERRLELHYYDGSGGSSPSDGLLVPRTGMAADEAHSLPTPPLAPLSPLAATGGWRQLRLPCAGGLSCTAPAELLAATQATRLPNASSWCAACANTAMAACRAAALAASAGYQAVEGWREGGDGGECVAADGLLTTWQVWACLAALLAAALLASLLLPSRGSRACSTLAQEAATSRPQLAVVRAHPVPALVTAPTSDRNASASSTALGRTNAAAEQTARDDKRWWQEPRLKCRGGGISSPEFMGSELTDEDAAATSAV